MREKRTPNLGHDEGMKLTKIDACIELHTIILQCHNFCGGGLIKVHPLKQGL